MATNSRKLVDHPWKVRIDRRVRCTKKAARTTRAKINLHATSRRRCLFTYPRLLFPSAFPVKRSARFLFAWSQIGTPPRLHHRAPGEINGVGTRASAIRRRLLLIYRVKVHGGRGRGEICRNSCRRINSTDHFLIRSLSFSGETLWDTN